VCNTLHILHEKNNFVEVKIILLDHQNNYVECLNVNNNTTKSFNILLISLSVSQNYFNGPKLFSNLCLAKFLDISTKPFFIVH